MILAETSDALRVHVIIGHAGRGADAATWLVCCALERSHAVSIRDALQSEADEFHAWASSTHPMRDSSGYTQMRTPEHFEIADEIVRRLAVGPLPLLTDAGFRYDEVGSWYEVLAVGEDPAVAAEHVAGQPERWQKIPAPTPPAPRPPYPFDGGLVDVALFEENGAECSYAGYARQRVNLRPGTRVAFPTCGEVETPVRLVTAAHLYNYQGLIMRVDLVPRVAVAPGTTLSVLLTPGEAL